MRGQGRPREQAAQLDLMVSIKHSARPGGGTNQLQTQRTEPQCPLPT